MKSKKGFTLVELLAVIAILAILVIIAIPNVLNLYRNARENAFVTEVQEIIKSSQQGYLNGALSNKDCMCFSSASNPLDIDARNNLEYYVEFNNNGEVINLTVKDKNYEFVSENEVINVSDIGNSRSGKEKTTQPVQESTEVPSCDGSSSGSGDNSFDIKYTSMLRVFPDYAECEYADSTPAYLCASFGTSSQIESLKITNTNKVPEGVLGSEDVSDDGEGNIMMWWTDTDGDELYEVTIGGKGGVRANTDSHSLFSDMYSLESIDLAYLDTSQVTNMEKMFYGSNMKTLDLSNFNTSQVTSMFYMFNDCTNLQTIMFGKNFNTLNVTDMNRMFEDCSSLTTLDLSHFTIRDDADLECMFEGTNDALDIKGTGLPNYESLQERLVCSY